MSRAEKLLTRLREVKERDMIAEQDVIPADGETETEGDEEEGDGDPNPFSKENRNPDGSIKVGDKEPINDKKRKRRK